MIDLARPSEGVLELLALALEQAGRAGFAVLVAPKPGGGYRAGLFRWRSASPEEAFAQDEVQADGASASAAIGAAFVRAQAAFGAELRQT